MNVLGYLVTLANIQGFGQPGASLKDVSIRVNECGKLLNELRNDKEFNLECLRQNSFCKVGKIGKYISKNLYDFMFNGNVDPKSEGLILTLYYTDESAPNAIVTRSNAEKPAVQDNSGTLEEASSKDGPQRFFMATPDTSEADGHDMENYINGNSFHGYPYGYQ